MAHESTPPEEFDTNTCPLHRRKETRHKIALDKVHFDRIVAIDEIDLESGFIMLPQSIPQPASTLTPGAPLSGTPPAIGPTVDGAQPGTTPAPASQPGGTPAAQTQVELTFTADRTQLFTAWNAVANLADMAGNVTVTVKAENPAGLDKAKLQNGVIEPLREADLIE